MVTGITAYKRRNILWMYTNIEVSFKREKECVSILHRKGGEEKTDERKVTWTGRIVQV